MLLKDNYLELNFTLFVGFGNCFKLNFLLFIHFFFSFTFSKVMNGKLWSIFWLSVLENNLKSKLKQGIQA